MRVFDVSDPNELGADSRVTRRFPRNHNVHQFRLRDPSLLRQRFDAPISRMAIRTVGDLIVTYAQNRFGTEVSIHGDGLDHICFSTILRGSMAVVSDGQEIVGAGRVGLAYRGLPGTQFLTSDASERLNLWLDAAKLEQALASRLGEHLRCPLQFSPTIDWGAGLAASLQAQIGYIARDLARPDGIASNPVALASFSDLMTQLALAAVPHNYTGQLGQLRAGAVPIYVTRADAFMRAHAATPLRLDDVASAAGCSVRALSQAYRRFRSSTPLAALHAIRLEHVRTELQHGDALSTTAIARRYGFTNPARFAAAYRERFGESPAQSTRR